MPFEDKRVRPPTTCSTGRCRNPIFAPDTGSVEGVDWQKIRIQVGVGWGGVGWLGLFLVIATGDVYLYNIQ